jgi:hypothetical protein
MGSDLFFPASAERSRAECRLPMSARSPPAFRSATDNGSHVMDVGSATAITPGHCDRRLVKISMPASVGATTKSSSVSPAPLTPGRRTTTWWLATTAASMPIATGLVASSGTRVLLSLLRTSVPRSELTDGAHGYVREDPRARSRPWTRAPEPLRSGGATAQVTHACRSSDASDATAGSRRDRTPSIPSIESTREQSPGDDLFHEPEAQPEFVTAEAPSRDHPTWPPLR